MTHLAHDAFERAARFLVERARPLEAELFRHDFEGAPAGPGLDALARFQNTDGGYGHGLEPDVRTPSSGALATAIGLTRLTELGAGRGHAGVEAARGYLERTLDPERWTWRIVPADTGSYPHAPWWETDGIEERFGNFLVNPRAAVVAGLLHVEPAPEQGWLGPLVEHTVRAIETRELEMHELLAALSLLEAPGLTVSSRARVRAACEQGAARLVANDPADWDSYGLRPLGVAPRPDSPLHHQVAEAVETNLEWLIAKQGEDGGWSPNWTWGEDSEAWDEARREWQGVVTLDVLRALRAYGRIEGVPPAPRTALS